MPFTTSEGWMLTVDFTTFWMVDTLHSTVLRFLSIILYSIILSNSVVLLDTFDVSK